jgi:hypothetical protein
VDSALGNPPQLRPAVIGGAINLAVSQHSFRLSLILIVSVRPICDIQVAEKYCSSAAGFGCEADFYVQAQLFHALQTECNKHW